MQLKYLTSDKFKFFADDNNVPVVLNHRTGKRFSTYSFSEIYRLNYSGVSHFFPEEISSLSLNLIVLFPFSSLLKVLMLSKIDSRKWCNVVV